MEIQLNTQATPTEYGAKSRQGHLWELSKKLEATFLNEMLSSAGLAGGDSDFNGGVGEAQFQSFLNQTRADAIVEAGGIGLAESIYRSLSPNGVQNERS